MSKLMGKSIVICDKTCLTYKKHGVVRGYDGTLKKYVIDFDGSWQGWYKLKQLKVVK